MGKIARWLRVAVALTAGAGGLAAAEDAPVALPWFLVEEAMKGPPWRYAQAMGYEILSRCDESTTRRVVEAHDRLNQLLAEILPPTLQVSWTVRPVLILYDEELQPKGSQEVIARMLRSQADPRPKTKSNGPVGNASPDLLTPAARAGETSGTIRGWRKFRSRSRAENPDTP